MLKISKPGPNRVDVEFSGNLGAEAMKAGLDELISLSGDVENGRMLYRIGGFRLPTLGALGIGNEDACRPWAEDRRQELPARGCGLGGRLAPRVVRWEQLSNPFPW